MITPEMNTVIISFLTDATCYSLALLL